MNLFELDNWLLAALKEDIGTGDITTNACVPRDARSQGAFRAKEFGILCGVDIAARVFALIDPSIAFTALKKDGDPVPRGEGIATISGPSRGILIGERVALNLMQHLSGIATATARAVAETIGTKAKIVDTRKTTPGLRALEKYAVQTGGGFNHRFGLYDGILIKDNHITAAGGIAQAIEAARQNAPHLMKIEVETETLEQVRQALEAGADVILLDNMDDEKMREAVELIGGRALTEASGNMGERSLHKVAETGVDFISIGALTHSVRAMDISLKFK